MKNKQQQQAPKKKQKQQQPVQKKNLDIMLSSSYYIYVSERATSSCSSSWLLPPIDVHTKNREREREKRLAHSTETHILPVCVSCLRPRIVFAKFQNNKQQQRACTVHLPEVPTL